MSKKINLDEKILVAGSSGMAGSAICRSLKKAGYGDKKLKGKIFTPQRSELNFLNLDSTKSWFRANKPTVLIIAAARVGGILANSSKPADFLFDNLRIQNNLFETIKEFGIKRLLFLGSSCIYPKFSIQPIKEDYLLSGYLEATNQWYAVAKITGIKLCESFRKQYGIDALSLMPTNLYGPGDNYHKSESHVMASLIRKFYEAKTLNQLEVNCWGTGSPLREFLHVDDLGRAVIFALENWDPNDKKSPKNDNGETLSYLNVGTGIDISIKKLAELIANEYGYFGKIKWDHNKPDGTPKKLLDITRIREMGWEPKITLEAGVRRTISEFKEIYNSKNFKG